MKSKFIIIISIPIWQPILLLLFLRPTKNI